ncbi:uncharacterized protein MELLADRAFT_103918 [Melampsora larici-populina 98AG31]|uniref:Uncharacterized protein n=1 Tax=Melampsora larici-populina (strain 98AG31 / pathotype 3-4-7) TaxID=747676 RepID=F4RCZ7_MELLP|nr:uncharacterized protein MELLADRAFT_103918 [Melampsora larici-populina 98AG31]EGG09901.1 hypothetical protein MELLADRAFT_103918 [Melampsora larici-populina 98AG31]
MGRKRNTGWFYTGPSPSPLDSQRLCNLPGYVEVSPVITECSKARSGLNELILDKTKGSLKKWPWTNCVTKLEKKGYELRLKPGSTTPFDLITSPSSHLRDGEAKKINNDLELELIEVVEI